MKAPKTTKLFNMPIINEKMDAVLTWLFQPGRKTISFANAHCINVASTDQDYRWALKKSCAILPDGSGLQLAARFAGTRFVQNLNGTDLFPPLMKKAAQQKKSVYFFGSQQGVAEQAARTAQTLFPDLKVAGTRHGFFTLEEEAGIIETINSSGADILLVGLGVPKQEIWLSRNRHRLIPQLVFGVGAQFDFWSGRVTRAPVWFRDHGIEWLWRLGNEPRRLFKRYVLGNPIFIARGLRSALAEKFSFNSDDNLRRYLDVALSSGTLLGLSPLFGLIALAIKLESRGPVFFTQMRIGQDGVPFKIYKFRSMFKDAEARRKELLATSERKGVCFKNRNDPRVTRVGRILRRLSLDELPQIINVFRGDMAIVGPRPALPQEVEAYPQAALGRLSIKPGITGLWQVSGRAEVSFDRMVRMDLAYTRTRSILSDIAMIALTFRAVITGRGAY